MIPTSKIMASQTTSLIFSLLSLSLLLATSHATFSQPISLEELGLKSTTDDDNLTQLTFYYHDVVSGSNPTSVQIAQAKGASASFGSLSMLDDPLTEAPEADSKAVGRAQGMFALADQSELAPIMIMNLVFQEGDYNGSTLSVLGRNPVNQPTRELPVVGGTGAFRFAKGYAVAKTHTFDRTTGDSVVEYNVYVSHADGGTGIAGSGSDGGSGSGFDGSGSSGGGGGGSKPNGASSHGLGFMSSLCLLSLVYLAYFG